VDTKAAAINNTEQPDNASADHSDEWIKCKELRPLENQWVSGLTNTGAVVPAILRNNGDSCYFETAGNIISEGAIVAWQPRPYSAQQDESK